MAAGTTLANELRIVTGRIRTRLVVKLQTAATLSASAGTDPARPWHHQLPLVEDQPLVDGV